MKKKLFATLLDQSSILSKFNGQLGANECIFSYPDSEWYGIYLLDQDGNKYWDSNSGRVAMYYIKMSINGSVIKILNETIDINETDLVGKRACVINENGNCVLPPKEAPSSKAAPKTRRTTSVSSLAGPSQPQAPVEQEVISRLETLSLNPQENVQSREEVPREYFEQMKNKMLIIQWMLEKMKTEDIVECIKRGSLNPQDVRAAEATIATQPEPAVEMAATMEPEEVKNIFKQITREDIVKGLKALGKDQRTTAVLNLCKRFGYTSKISNKTGKTIIYDGNGDPLSVDEAIDQCSEFEARRIRDLILRSSRRFKTFRSPQPSTQPSTQSISVESFISQLNSLGTIDEKIAMLSELCKGYTIRKSKDSKRIVIFDSDGESVDLEEAIAACISENSFGKRINPKLIFKKAAKQCKGTGKKYKSCMKKVLRKMYNK
jgi:hypothetical protein